MQNNFLHIKNWLLLCLCLYIQGVGIAIAQAKPTLKLYHCAGDWTPQMLSNYKSRGMPKVPIFDGRYLDPKNEQILNEKLLTQAIIANIPNPKATGIAVLDWEGDAMQTLAKGADTSAQYLKTIGQFIKAIKLAKAIRPNMQWGYYFVPLTDYWLNDTTALQKTNKKLSPLLKICDIFLPSMYSAYPDTTTFTHNLYYIQYNIIQTLKLGLQYKKPVVVFVWHRWHEGDHSFSLKLIPQTEFYNSLKQMVDIKIKGKRIDGLIWFIAEAYFLAQKPSLLKQENPLNKPMQIHTQDVTEQYAKLFFELKKYYSGLK